MTKLSKRAASIMGIAAITVVVIILFAITLPPPPRQDLYYSFEDNMEGWVANGIDLDDPVVNWSISWNNTTAKDGSACLKLYLENFNDKGKIWIERPFNVTPSRQYRIIIEYAFASNDYGTANLWRIIAGALPSRPDSVDDVSAAYQDSTGNGRDLDEGYIWLDKRYEARVQSGNDGLLWIIIGVWGTWETPRTYFLDAIHLTLVQG